MKTTLAQARTFVAAILCATAVEFTTAAWATPDPDLDVNIQIVDGEIRANVSMFVRAPQQRVWDVIVDYERAPEYMRDLRVSKVISRTGNTLRVMQKDQVHYGPFTFAVDTVKDVRLTAPVRAESHLVSGSMKKYEAVTELMPTAGGTRVTYRSQSIPESALATLAGESTVKRITEERFRQVRAEILRREVVAAQQH
ncbi:MAG TPA: SRPBCC family protein [Burkholderiales bacterium]|nr:SRPBCC family protein [Burkholderiales bacterium]